MPETDNSSSEGKPVGMSSLFTILNVGEKIFLTLIVVLLIAHRMGYNTVQPAQFAFFALAAVYFLMAYRPLAPAGDSAPGNKGFADLLFLTILPKVGWIACSVLVVGIMFRLLHLPGATEMMSIGTIAGLIPIALIGMGLAQGSDKARPLLPLLMRIVALEAVCVYYLFFLVAK